LEDAVRKTMGHHTNSSVIFNSFARTFELNVEDLLTKTKKSCAKEHKLPAEIENDAEYRSRGTNKVLQRYLA
jgi:hypothetical protein